MIPLTYLYGEYIDRPKLSEQKKPFNYIVPPPRSGVGKNRVFSVSDWIVVCCTSIEGQTIGKPIVKFCNNSD